MLMRKLGIAVAAFSVLTGASAQQGYFDFGQIPGVPSEPSVQIDLGPALINFAAEAARQSDPAAADLMAGLRGIRVLVYEELIDPVAVNAFVDEASSGLERDGWGRVVSVQDNGSKVRIYAQTSGAEIDGMTVLVLDGSEAVFINIAGRIDPAQLGRIASTMGFDGVISAISAAGAMPGAQGGAGEAVGEPAARAAPAHASELPAERSGGGE